MKIIHRVNIGNGLRVADELRSLGISFNGPSSPLVSTVWFDIDEDHPGWPKLKHLLPQWQAGNIVHTEFSAAELANAKYLETTSAWFHGYPQPDDDFGYKKITYDPKEYCSTCGIGAKQVAPFRTTGEPRWRSNSIMQLNWVYDAYFVLPSVWEEVFRPLGIGCIPVVHHRTGKKLSRVVQLEIKETAKSALLLGDKYPSEICGSCGRKKYLPVTHGFFPAFAADPQCQICRTQEWFGSGASAFNAIIISQRVYQAMRDHKVRGMTFVALQE
jgi:hypothetical protein